MIIAAAHVHEISQMVTVYYNLLLKSVLILYVIVLVIVQPNPDSLVYCGQLRSRWHSLE